MLSVLVGQAGDTSLPPQGSRRGDHDFLLGTAWLEPPLILPSEIEGGEARTIRRVELSGRLGGEVRLLLWGGEGCTLNPYGDPVGCLPVGPLARTVRLEPRYVADPGRERWLYELKEAPTGRDWSLVIATEPADGGLLVPASGPHRLIISGDDGGPATRVLTLEPPGDREARVLAGRRGLALGILGRSDPAARATGTVPVLRRRQGSDEPLPPGAIARMGSTALSHRDSIISMDASHDGAFLTSIGEDRTVRLWVLGDRSELARIDAEASAVACSRDGRLLGWGAADGNVRVYDVAARTQVVAARVHDGRVVTLAFSHDGALLASAGRDGRVGLFRADTGEARHVLATTDTVALAFSADGAVLTTGDTDLTVRQWDTATGQRTREFRAIIGGADGDGGDPAIGPGLVVLSGDGLTLALASDAAEFPRPDGADRLAHVWDVAAGRRIARLEVPGDFGEVTLLALSGDGRRLAASLSGWNLVVWDDVSRPRDFREFRMDFPVGDAGGTSRPHVRGLVFAGDLLAAIGGQAVVVLDAADGREVLPRHRDQIVGQNFSPDGRILATRADTTVRLWDAHSGEHLRKIRCGEGSAVAFSPDGAILATPNGPFSGSITLRDPATGREIRTLTGHDASASLVTFSPDGAILASLGAERRFDFGRSSTIRLWDVITGRQIRQIESGRFDSLIFLPDGRTIAAGRGDNRANLRSWDIGTGRMVADVEIEENLTFMNTSTALSRDGTRLALRAWGRAGSVPTLHVYDVMGRVEVLTVEDVGIGGLSFGLSPDGELIAVGKPDGVMEVWDIAANRRVATLGGHAATVTAVEFSADGATLSSGSRDSTALVWELGRE